MPTVNTYARRSDVALGGHPEKFAGVRRDPAGQRFAEFPANAGSGVASIRYGTRAVGIGFGFGPSLTANHGPYVYVDRADVSISVDSSPFFTSPSGGVRYHAATVTYPDGWETFSFDYESDLVGAELTTIRHYAPTLQITTPRSGRHFSFGGRAERGELSVPMPQILTAPNASDFDITRVELDFNGSMHDMALTPTGPNGTGPLLPYAVDLSLEHTFVGTSGTPMRGRVTQRNGVVSAWYAINMNSVAEFTYDDTGSPLFLLDSLDSFSPTGIIHDIVWQRSFQEFGGPTQEGFTPSSTARQVEADLSDFADGAEAILRLDVRTEFTAGTDPNYLYPPVIPYLPPGGPGFEIYGVDFIDTQRVTVENPSCSTLQHRLGHFLTAFNEAGGVRVNDDNGGSYFFDGYSSPTLYHKADPKAGGAVVICLHRRSDSVWVTWISANIGRTWEFVEMVLNSNYVSVTVCGTTEGVEVVAAIRKSDKVLMVWRAGVLQPPVATLGKVCALSLKQRSEVDSMDLILFQAPAVGQDSVKWESKNGGRTWAVMAE